MTSNFVYLAGLLVAATSKSLSPLPYSGPPTSADISETHTLSDEPPPETTDSETLKSSQNLNYQKSRRPFQAAYSDKLKVASFSIQVFGRSKVSKPEVLTIITQILQRYDLVLIQEIRDRSQKALPKLLRAVNQLSPEDPFESVVSERLGRTVSKEQYGFLYRSSRLKLIGTYQYDDGADDGKDAFEREPFAVRFASPTTELEDFAIIGTHVAPGKAMEEIDKLTTVYRAVEKHWESPNILLAGDLNADCSYVKASQWANVSLRRGEQFRWLIGDSQDTTMGTTDCSYDRFVTASEALLSAIVPGSVRVYRFDDDMGLDLKQGLAVSDHYPIELQLKGKVNRKLQQHFHTGLSFTITNDEPVTESKYIRAIYRSAKNKMAGFESKVLLDGSKMYEVKATKGKVKDVIAELQEFGDAFPNVITTTLVSLVQAYLDSSVFQRTVFINGLDVKASVYYEVIVICRLQKPYTCKVQVSKHLT